MNKINVLVVDDSPFVCQLLTSWLEADPGIQVVGWAHDGQQAVEGNHSLRPDVVTLDLEMPGLKGTEALTAIMQDRPVPVLVISGVSRRSAALTMQALDLGAVDFILKYTPGAATDPEKLQQEIIAKVLIAAQTKAHLSCAINAEADLVAAQPKSMAMGADTAAMNFVNRLPEASSEKRLPTGVVVVGASMGGPRAIRQLMTALPSDFSSSMVIVQHLPAPFTKVFAEQLNNRVWMQVREAVNGDELHQGVALVAPGGCHLLLESGNRIRVEQGEPWNGHCPSIDLTMQSAAQSWKQASCGVLLTGLGGDGAVGMKEIREQGGKTYAQEPESCVVSHLPQQAIDIGIVDHIAKPVEIAGLLAAF